jgi:hypothetical protein
LKMRMSLFRVIWHWLQIQIPWGNRAP